MNKSIVLVFKKNWKKKHKKIKVTEKQLSFVHKIRTTRHPVRIELTNNGLLV